MKDPNGFLKRLMRRTLRHRLVPDSFRLVYEKDESHNEPGEEDDHHLVVTNDKLCARVQVADGCVCVFIERCESDYNSLLDELKPNCAWTSSEKRATLVFERCLAQLPLLNQQIIILYNSYGVIKDRFIDLFEEAQCARDAERS